MVSEKQDLEPKKKRVNVVNTFVVLILTSIILALAIALAVVCVRYINDEEKDVCLTEGCARAAARVSNAIDRSVKPCDNFYDFACGKWVKKHVIPEDHAAVDVWSILRDDVEVICKYLLENPKRAENDTAIQKAKDLYRSCANEELIESKGTSVAVPLLEELGGWPVLGNKPGGHWNESHFNITRLMTTLRKYNNKVIIDMSVGIDDKNSSNFILQFDQQGFGMPDRSYYLDPQLDLYREAYTMMAKQISMAFGADPIIADKDMRAALELEIDLANITMPPSARRNNDALYNKMNLSDLAVEFPEPNMGENIQFNWMEYVQSIFSLDGVNVTVDETEPVLVRDLVYYNQLFGVLQKYPKRTIANYMVWRIMQHRANNLGREFRDIVAQYSEVMYGSTPGAHWRSCLSYTIVQLGQAVGKLFVQEVFDETAKGTALDMIHGIKNAFIQILLEEKWMDEKTKQAAREKAQAMTEWIGYADEIIDNNNLNDLYSDVEVNRTEYFQNVLGNLQRWGNGDLQILRVEVDKNSWSDPPTTVNAQYSFILNNIQFPAGIFQPPFYDKDQLRSMNYGGIGVTIGHEITHGFDDQAAVRVQSVARQTPNLQSWGIMGTIPGGGTYPFRHLSLTNGWIIVNLSGIAAEGRKYNKDGNLKNWWDVSVIDKFRNRATCFVNQYGGFEVPEVNGKINGKLTLGENIADNGGLKESFRAYRNFINAQGHEDPLLPGLDFNNNQLFFINFAQVWCHNERKQSLLNSLATDPHSPSKYRVLGTLQNSEDFAETFQCPRGSFMNPVNKCHLW